MAALKPDLLFLDVQMPGETGMELLESLEPPVPQVIFTTAYDEFAVKAFELNALDYLLKPVDPARLAAAVGRLRRRARARPGRRRPAGRLASGRQGVRAGGGAVLVRRGRPDPPPGKRGKLHARPLWRRAAAALPLAQRDGGEAGPQVLLQGQPPPDHQHRMDRPGSSPGSAAGCSSSSRAARRWSSAGGRPRSSASG